MFLRDLAPDIVVLDVHSLSPLRSASPSQTTRWEVAACVQLTAANYICTPTRCKPAAASDAEAPAGCGTRPEMSFGKRCSSPCSHLILHQTAVCLRGRRAQARVAQAKQLCELLTVFVDKLRPHSCCQFLGVDGLRLFAAHHELCSLLNRAPFSACNARLRGPRAALLQTQPARQGPRALAQERGGGRARRCI